MTAPLAAIDVVRHPGEPDLVHVVVTDAEGAVGTGETHGHASAVAALVAELAPGLLGAEASPGAVRAKAAAGPYGTRSAGGAVSVESRAASALDTALWDLAARRQGRGLGELLGPAGAGGVRAYATCMGADHDASRDDPVGLIRSMGADGFGIIKVWPFKPGGDHDAALGAVRALVGHGVDVAVDLVGWLSDEAAADVCRDLDRLGLAWIEDPLPDDELARLPALTSGLRTPVCTGERLTGPGAFAGVVAAGAAIVHVDVAWCGGPSAVAEIVGLVASAGRRLALHDVSGPVAWATSLHLAGHCPVPAFVECDRLAVAGRYAAIAAAPLPDPASGLPPTGPGHGVALSPGYLAAAAVDHLGPRP
jgi:L-alanine-DL-glutamate epimerase-like enolase superfamily enzyme